ncbi:MAG TPA: hypothetical protein GX509_00150 [Firmicutes bacterium]|nr:hypothetical protein [Bacillota bacterium]
MLVKESSFVQDWINEGRRRGLAEGIRKGVEQGIEKGIEKGEILALQNAILDVLEERFGMVDEGLGRQLRAVDDLKLLKSLHRMSIKALSVDDFRAEIAKTLPIQ